jgi:hypothetical protein
MLVSHRKRFIYTKTIKTAGTSVEVYFEPYCMPEGSWEFSHHREEHVSEAGIIGYRGPRQHRPQVQWWNHMSAAAIRERLGKEVWNSYFKFCVIRNPFDKAISVFHFAKARRARWGAFQPRELVQRLKEWLARSSSGDLKTQFKRWLTTGRLPQDHDQFLINGKVCVDYFIRQEALADGVRHVCEVLSVGFEPEKILRLKASSRPQGRTYADYYDADSVALVKKAYRFEVEQFGYPDPI